MAIKIRRRHLCNRIKIIIIKPRHYYTKVIDTKTGKIVIIIKQPLLTNSMQHKIWNRKREPYKNYGVKAKNKQTKERTKKIKSYISPVEGEQ